MSENDIKEILQLPEPPSASAWPKQRKRGGQPGNLNAIRHGLYVQGTHIRNTTPLERAELLDLRVEVQMVRNYMRHLYTLGLASKDLIEVNETSRSLSLAAIGLARLLKQHDDSICTSTPMKWDNEDSDRDLTLAEIAEKLRALGVKGV